MGFLRGVIVGSGAAVPESAALITIGVWSRRDEKVNLCVHCGGLGYKTAAALRSGYLHSADAAAARWLAGVLKAVWELPGSRAMGDGGDWRLAPQRSCEIRSVVLGRSSFRTRSVIASKG